ncbi:MAG: DMT family transporter [Alphaproteobacteria bacterium]|nr:MAG: DMT family transporter [Alphaproteobacteria bacterium]
MSPPLSRQDFWNGCLLAVIAAICFGIQAPLAKSIYTHGMDIYSFMAVGRLVQCFGVGIVLHFLGHKLWTGISDYRPAAAISIIFLSFSWLHYSAIQYLDIAPVTMLVFLYPLILAALHIWLDKTQLTRAFLLSLLTAFAGLALVIQPDKIMQSDFNWMGATMAFCAGILIATYLFISGKILQSKDPLVFTVHLSFIPAIAFSVLSIVHGIALPPIGDATGWSLMVFSLCLSLLGQICFFVAIKKITALRVSLVLKLEPVAAVLGAIWILGEHIEFMQYLGIFLVVSAIFAVSQPVGKTEIQP